MSENTLTKNKSVAKSTVLKVFSRVLKFEGKPLFIAAKPTKVFYLDAVAISVGKGATPIIMFESIDSPDDKIFPRGNYDEAQTYEVGAKVQLGCFLTVPNPDFSEEDGKALVERYGANATTGIRTLLNARAAEKAGKPFEVIQVSSIDYLEEQGEPDEI